MTQTIQVLLILVPFACFLAAPYCKARPAFWIFRVAGLAIALCMAGAVLARSLCAGTLNSSFGPCAAGMDGLFNLLRPVLLAGVGTGLMVGPVLLALAVIFEIAKRTSKTGSGKGGSGKA